ncbi:MAG: hypothetical protein BJ554DRAFT_1687 [Olpidium bornovanus]|uniref:Uncharacterized protein n=1 Tax=Olpidium bornovanus TaxID=278681 RepID=A0A8H8DHI4_9FUNG|nr:MAG: hypothetical protein BJ554DRAFT_1687 [Olpidium bornovanus]
MKVHLANLRLQSFPLAGNAFVHYFRHGRSPLLEFECPVGKGRERHDNKERAVLLLDLHQVCDQRDGLDGLAESHLVGQDAVQAVVVQRHHPLQALELVFLERAADKDRRLLVDHLFDPVGLAVVIALDLCFFKGLSFVVHQLHSAAHSGVAVQLVSLLGAHALGKVVEILVRLLEEVSDARVLGLVHQLQIRLFVIILQGRQTGFGHPVRFLGLLLFHRVVIGHDLPGQDPYAVLLAEVEASHLRTVVEHSSEKIVVLLLFAAVAFCALLSLQALRHAGFPQGLLFHAPVGGPVALRHERRRAGHAFDHLLAQPALPAEKSERLQLDERLQFRRPARRHLQHGIVEVHRPAQGLVAEVARHFLQFTDPLVDPSANLTFTFLREGDRVQPHRVQDRHDHALLPRVVSQGLLQLRVRRRKAAVLLRYRGELGRLLRRCGGSRRRLMVRNSRLDYLFREVARGRGHRRNTGYRRTQTENRFLEIAREREVSRYELVRHDLKPQGRELGLGVRVRRRTRGSF